MLGSHKTTISNLNGILLEDGARLAAGAAQARWRFQERKVLILEMLEEWDHAHGN